MGKDLWIEHMALMLRNLDEDALRAVYMIVKELYIRVQPKQE